MAIISKLIASILVLISVFVFPENTILRVVSSIFVLVVLIAPLVISFINSKINK